MVSICNAQYAVPSKTTIEKSVSLLLGPVNYATMTMH